jgi:hypothetical protein
MDNLGHFGTSASLLGVPFPVGAGLPTWRQCGQPGEPSPRPAGARASLLLYCGRSPGRNLGWPAKRQKDAPFSPGGAFVTFLATRGAGLGQDGWRAAVARPRRSPCRTPCPRPSPGSAGRPPGSPSPTRPRPTAGSWAGSSRPGTRPHSGNWSAGSGQWSSASAAGAPGTTTRPRTPSRPRSWSWPGGPPTWCRGRRSAAGFTGSPSVRPRRPAPCPPDAEPAKPPSRPCPTAPPPSPMPRTRTPSGFSTRRSAACRTTSGRRSPCASWRGLADGTRWRGWVSRRGRSPAGWPRPGRCWRGGSGGAASP